MQQKSVALTEPQWKELENEAKGLKITVSEYLRRLVSRARETRAKIIEEG